MYIGIIIMGGGGGRVDVIRHKTKDIARTLSQQKGKKFWFLITFALSIIRDKTAKTYAQLGWIDEGRNQLAVVTANTNRC